ncbi:MAG: copper homeostasis protein CutC [Bacteroidota bacterium]
MTGLEICANSFVSALAAEQGGAMRVELCENMAEGGTTPSYATIKMAKKRLKIEVWPIIRPRGGDFLYTVDEVELMKVDIQICKDLGCDGVVFGILLPYGEIDKENCKQLIALAHPMPTAFHRAFDMCENLEKGLEDLIELGFVRVLTSGGAENAYNGIEKIAKLVQLADGRIEIMPGAGINPQNITSIKERTGARVFHASARIKISSKMEYRNQNSKMGSIADEYSVEQTSVELVSELVKNLN